MIDDAELVGGVLVDVPDPDKAGRDLAAILTDPSTRDDPRFDADLVGVLRHRLGGDPKRIERACDLGAAWVLGRRSVTEAEPWELVASLPQGVQLPSGLRRTTGETLMHLVVSATRRIRIVAPFMDRRAMSFLSDALAAATARGVSVEVLSPTRSTHAAGALADLEETIVSEGRISNYSVVGLRADAPWVHLKVLSSDATAAYIGSANVTTAGIGGPNLELGILIRRPAVETVHQLLDLFKESGA